jgi:hypothetical protein
MIFPEGYCISFGMAVPGDKGAVSSLWREGPAIRYAAKD